MALSRPFLLALVGLVLLAATVFAVQNARDSSQGTSAATGDQQAPAQPAQGGSAPAAELSPQQLLEAAASTDVSSARFDAQVSVKAAGDSAEVSVDGAAQSVGGTPEVDVDVKFSAAGQMLTAGFVTTDGNAWLTKDGVGYKVPEDSWKAVMDAAKDRDAAGPVALPVDPSGWVKNVKSEGSETLDGVDAEHITASLDAGAALADISKLAEQQAGPGQGATLPPQVLAKVEDSVKKADFDVYIGKDDKVIRRLSADVEARVPNAGAFEVALELNLSDVNEPQQIEPPTKVTQKVPGGLFGQFAQGFYTGLSLTTGADASALGLGVPTTNAHLKAERAVADHRKVVISFQNPRGLDDRAVAASVRALDRSTKKVVVLTDHVGNVDEYGSLVQDLGVNQAPSIVVIDRGGQARLIEGYVDAETLAQVVADAR